MSILEYKYMYGVDERDQSFQKKKKSSTPSPSLLLLLSCSPSHIYVRCRYREPRNYAFFFWKRIRAKRMFLYVVSLCIFDDWPDIYCLATVSNAEAKVKTDSDYCDTQQMVILY